MSATTDPAASSSDAAQPFVTIYTDGGCIPNPGPGGYAALLSYGDRVREVCGGYRWTTNNRMEIMAVIAGLRALTRPCDVVLYSDSLYVVKAISRGWAARWQASGWMRTATEAALNPDLWEQVLSFCTTHNVSARWVRGHSGNVHNERCDRLSRQIAKQSDLPRSGIRRANQRAAQAAPVANDGLRLHRFRQPESHSHAPGGVLLAVSRALAVAPD